MFDIFRYVVSFLCRSVLKTYMGIIAAKVGELFICLRSLLDGVK